MKEGHLDRARIAFDGPRYKRGNYKVSGGKRGVRGRRQMIAMAHEGADIAPVEPYRRQRPLPSERIQWVMGVVNGRQTLLPLDDDAPNLLVLLAAKLLIHLRDGQHTGVEQGMVSHEAACRQSIAIVCR